MSLAIRIKSRVAAAVAIGCAGLTLASTAGAVDLRDWGRKYNSASERFVVLASFNNEAVLDKETQLVWRRAAKEASVWTAAFHYCLVSATGGRQGWRLPSQSELTSLIGTTVSTTGGVLPASHPFQNLGTQADYWSSTESATHANVAYTKSLLSPWTSQKYKSELNPFLCVRGVGTERS